MQVFAASFFQDDSKDNQGDSKQSARWYNTDQLQVIWTEKLKKKVFEIMTMLHANFSYLKALFFHVYVDKSNLIRHQIQLI